MPGGVLSQGRGLFGLRQQTAGVAELASRLRCAVCGPQRPLPTFA